MKTQPFFKTLMVILFGTLLLWNVGCRSTDNDDDEEDDTELVKGKCNIEAEITGDMTAYFQSDLNFSAMTVASGYYSLAGSDGSSAFAIVIPENIAKGTYTMSDSAIGPGTQFGYTGANFGYVASKNLNSDITITITASGNGIIEGYFTGKMKNLDDDIINVNVDFVGAY